MEDADQTWQDSDLHLAAELGKALLERNRELDSQLAHQQQTSHDQALEIEFLSKQVEALRDVNESRMRVFEELDKNAQELEKCNQRLLLDSRADKQRIDRLNETVEVLDNKCEDLQAKIDETKTQEETRLKQERRKTMSVPCLQDALNYKYCYNMESLCWTYDENFKDLPINPYEHEIIKLRDIIKSLRSQNGVEKRRRSNLEIEISVLLDENHSLEEIIKALEQNVLDMNKRELVIQKLQMIIDMPCIHCGKSVTEASSYTLEEPHTEVEYDEPLVEQEGKCVKLEGGGSLYGTEEAINKVSVVKTNDIGCQDCGLTEGLSILSELDAQYHSLIQKYEALLVNGKRGGNRFVATESSLDLNNVSHKGVQTLINWYRNSEGREMDYGNSNPPAYKLLFKELFANLRKNRIEEIPEQHSGSVTPASTPSSTPKSTPASTPVTTECKLLA